MKILCIGRNYADHIAELKNERPTEPVIFLKPDTAILKNNEPFYHPDFSKDIHHEVELLLRICKEGKHIEEKFASSYYDKIGLGIDFTARDLQSKAKEKGLPWDIAKGFNGSAPVSQWMELSEIRDIKSIDFHLEVNGVIRQKANNNLMIWNFDETIAYISKYFTLKIGDIIFTGTPAGVSKVNIGDKLEGFIGEKKVLDFEVK